MKPFGVAAVGHYGGLPKIFIRKARDVRDVLAKISVFGESKLDEVAKELNIPVLAKLPIRSEIAGLVDKGAVELAEITELYDAADKIKEALN